MAMNNDELGSNWLLVSQAWLSTPIGTLPNDDTILAKMARTTEEKFKAGKVKIMAPFHLNTEANIWEHPRLLSELKKQIDWRKKCSKGGKHSAESRGFKVKVTSTTLQSKSQHSVLQSPSSSLPTGIKPKVNGLFVPTPEQLELSTLLQTRILANLPNFKPPSELTGWCRDIDLMTRVDKRTTAQIRGLIEWCQKDAFWFKNILSMGKLRKQFDRLTAEMKKPSGGSIGGSDQSKPIAGKY